MAAPQNELTLALEASALEEAKRRSEREQTEAQELAAAKRRSALAEAKRLSELEQTEAQLNEVLKASLLTLDFDRAKKQSLSSHYRQTFKNFMLSESERQAIEESAEMAARNEARERRKAENLAREAEDLEKALQASTSDERKETQEDKQLAEAMRLSLQPIYKSGVDNKHTQEAISIAQNQSSTPGSQSSMASTLITSNQSSASSASLTNLTIGQDVLAAREARRQQQSKK